MKNRKIIIAEDDIASRIALVLDLEKLGYEVCSAENGKKALDLITKNPPDLLITDFDMPVLNGSELINCLGEKGYEFPVIISLGGINNINQDSIKYTGKLKYMDKFLPSSLLYQMIDNFLR